MDVHGNEKLIRHAYELWATGDLDLTRNALADTCVWHEPGRSALAGDYKGPSEIMAFLGRFAELSGSTFTVEIEAVLADSERAVVLQRETAQRDGKTLDVLAAIEYEIHHGKITEVTVYHGDTYAFDEFWS